MIFPSTRRCSTAWIALLALLASALAPTVGHSLPRLLAALSGKVVVANGLCTAGGIRAADLDIGSAKFPPAGGNRFEHCPLCVAAAEPPALPPLHLHSARIPPPAAATSALAPPAPPVAAIWIAIRPRAPPASA